MRKQWLSWCAVYLLGLATIPGVLVAQRLSRNSETVRPRFTDAVEVSNVVEEKSDADFVSPAVQTKPSVPAFQFSDEPDSFAEAERVSRGVGAKPPLGPVELPPPVGPRGPIIVEEDFETNLDRILRDEDSNLVADNTTAPLNRKQSVDLDLEAFEAPSDVPIRKAPLPKPTAKEESDRTESLAEPNPSDEEKTKLAALREKLSGLIKAKSELINEQTLEQEVFAIEKQISELHAAQQLLKAKEILAELAEKFPDSPAAARAKRMLEAGGGKPSSWKSERLRPEPEPVERTSALPTY